jgi:hypothetical protein
MSVTVSLSGMVIGAVMSPKICPPFPRKYVARADSRNEHRTGQQGTKGK